MICYQVNLQVLDTSRNEELLNWLRRHIDEMLQFDGFERAQLMLDIESNPSNFISIEYFVKDRQKLEDYFNNHTSKMRQEGINLFSGTFEASRRILFVSE